MDRDTIVAGAPASDEADHLHVRRLDRAIAQRTVLAGLAAEVDRPGRVLAHLGRAAALPSRP